ncbi:unnamed protein product [Cyprideis torosa]|uniref:Protein Wnt n=1 Tax=Cyprideis torosa TaxID=163714 RepID=A0A7R8ZLI6_9CRUS|nr:unnamed protein product [Cyprideis torosa]CAG0893280.1 unnamed protein product [Cyprideis torosa]
MIQFRVYAQRGHTASINSATPVRKLALPSESSRTKEFSLNTIEEDCSNVTFLNEKQKEACQSSTQALHFISLGAQLGMTECSHQFKHQRWNCSIIDEDVMFGRGLQLPTREKAYLHSVTSAGVTFAVTRACSNGKMESCSCDDRIHKRRRETGSWQWGGCSENINYGVKFSRQFIDAEESMNIWQRHEELGRKHGKPSADSLMNLHNNDAGRRVVRSMMERRCKCHGLSGSCTMQICWRVLPQFRKVSDELFERFKRATRVRYMRKKRRLRRFSRMIKRPTRHDLIFLDESPSYCDKSER